MKKILFILTGSMFLWSCHTEFDPDVNDQTVSAGTANFTTYVSLGNSLTAGYADGALYSSGQMYSYPALMSTQMALAGGGAFTQPMMPDNIGGFANLGVAGKLALQVVNGRLTPVPTAAVANFTPVTGKFNNVGVPGAKSFHLLAPGYGNPAGIASGLANPYYARFASSPTATVLADAMAKSPTFFSLWIGNNDVLSYATSGGIGVNQTGNTNPATYGPNDITDPGVFGSVYNTLVTTLTSSGAKGVVANLPYVTSIPFFTTVPYNPLSVTALGGATNVAQLNAQLYGPLSQILTAFGAGNRIKPLSTTAPNPVLIKDESLPNLSAQITAAALASGNPTLVALAPALGSIFGQARQATSTDLILLTTSGVIGTPNTTSPLPAPLNAWGVTSPLIDKHVLTATEVAECKVSVDAYNNIIANLASSKGLAFYDANADMQKLVSSSGITYNGVTFTSTFVSGGAFSLDGVHPTSKGYAIIANGFINAINKTYQSSLPLLNPNDYPGVSFPQ